LQVCRSPSSTLFPYTTLFRSLVGGVARSRRLRRRAGLRGPVRGGVRLDRAGDRLPNRPAGGGGRGRGGGVPGDHPGGRPAGSGRDRKSTRLNSSHVKISYAVF